MIDRLRFFLDFTEGGAWSFLVRGVIRLVNSVNERDLNLLIKVQELLRGFVVSLGGRMSSQEICTVAGSPVMLLRGTAPASG
jgi:hypothetical protein